MTDVARAGQIERISSLPVNIPEKHRLSDDTRIAWLWNQKLKSVQNIYIHTKSPRDKMACALILQAALASHLPSIELVLRRLEGGAVPDSEVLAEEKLEI